MTVQNVSEALPYVQVRYGTPFRHPVVRDATAMAPPTQQNLFDPPPARPLAVADSQPSVAYLPIYRVQLVHEAALAAPRTQIRPSADVAAVLRQFLGPVDREHFVVIMMDRKNRLIGIHTVSIGSLTASVVHPREVLKVAILSNAAALICGHNHPSGDPQPSSEDRTITKRLVEVMVG